jgi:hypothetical protein
MRTVFIFAVITLAYATIAICGLAQIALEQWFDSGAPPLDSLDSLDEPCNEMLPTRDPGHRDGREAP